MAFPVLIREDFEHRDIVKVAMDFTKQHARQEPQMHPRHDTRLPQVLVGVVVAVSVLPFVLTLLGVDFASPQAPLDLAQAPALSKPELVDALHHSLAGGFTHTILEWSAFSVAIFTAVLAALCFSLKRSEVATPIIGMALFCAGCMDAFHTLAATRLIDAAAANTDLIPFTWALCRLFNALILIVGVALVMARKKRHKRASKWFVLGTAAAFGVLAYATIIICASSRDLPQTMFPGALITRPYDVVPMVLFVIAGLTVVRSLHRRQPSYFSHALLIAIIPNVATQLHMSFGSVALFDHHFNIAHSLKIVAYLVPFAGLCLHYFSIQKEANELVESLTRSEARMRSTIENAGEAFVAFDESDHILDWNRLAVAEFGWSREEAKKITMAELVATPDGPGSEWQAHRASRADGAAVSTERFNLRAIRRNGDEFDAQVTVFPILRDDGTTFGAFIRNLTPELKAQEEKAIIQAHLAESHKLESIGQLAAGIAHEINTPTQFVGDNTKFLQESFEDLIPILKQASALADDVSNGAPCTDLAKELLATLEEIDFTDLEEEIPRAIDHSLDGIHRVSKIVQAMKEFSHPGSQSMTPVDLNHAIENTIAVARNEWKYVAELQVDFDSDLPLVPCLPGELNQVILNLVVNAAHAIAERVGNGKDLGTITISTKRIEECVEIRIRDTGAGIPESVKNKIYDPFFTTKEVGKGTGQGLSIARNVIVQQHGGSIDFETEANRGTTFIIRLPLLRDAKDAQEKAA